MALFCDRVDLRVLTGRWVRSDTKLDNWENYMRWYGMSEEKVWEETIEPQLHIVTAISKESMTLVHQLPWRGGTQIEYTVLMDGKYYPIPEGMFKTARSSWKVNKQANWMHQWTEEGLMCEQKLPVKGKDHVLRYTRTLPNANEIQVNVRLYEVQEDGGEKQVIHTIRYFHRMPFKERWTAAAAQFFSGTDVEANLQTCVKGMTLAKQKGADLVVLPENSNRDRDYFVDGKPSREKCYELSERLDGAFVRGLKEACKELDIWACVGVDLRGAAAPTVHICQVLIRPDGEIEGVHKKHVLWDYEYTLFEPGSEPYQIFDTELGRLGMLICADGIVPEAARVLALMGAQVLLNSLNSRGPDEMRVHIPLRAVENGVWHVASNAVGNPKDVGLLWPWTGGSEICAPDGTRVVASEEEDDIVVAEVRPFEAEKKASTWCKDFFAARRPELYGAMTKPLAEVPAAVMYGPAPPAGTPLPFDGPESVKVAMMQLSRVHTRKCTEWMTKRQINYAKRKGANVGVLPELWCFKRGEVQEDPKAAAEYSAQVLELMLAAAKEEGIHVCFSLVEAAAAKAPAEGFSPPARSGGAKAADGGVFYHTAYLVGPEGVVATYRKAHLDVQDEQWATPGDALAAVHPTKALGRVSLMLGGEVWIPEVSRCLALEGVELVLHPADWDRKEAQEMAATERGGENRFHLVSVTRLDSPGAVGSQTTLAGEYIGGEPIPLARYAAGVWTRYGVEEQVHVDLPRRQPHCKMMGDHLDVLKKRFPELYGVCTTPIAEIPTWSNTTKVLPGQYKDGFRYHLGAIGRKRQYDVMAPTEASVPIADN